MSPGPAAPKRRNINPVVARERARKGALARNTPDSCIHSLEAAQLTTAQKRRLAALLMPFLDGGEEPPAALAGAGLSACAENAHHRARARARVVRRGGGGPGERALLPPRAPDDLRGDRGAARGR